MQILVTELPIEDALGRAQARFQQADEHLARTVEASATGLPWALGGVALVCGGGVALAGVLPLAGQRENSRWPASGGSRRAWRP